MTSDGLRRVLEILNAGWSGKAVAALAQPGTTRSLMEDLAPYSDDVLVAAAQSLRSSAKWCPSNFGAALREQLERTHDEDHTPIRQWQECSHCDGGWLFLLLRDELYYKTGMGRACAAPCPYCDSGADRARWLRNDRCMREAMARLTPDRVRQERELVDAALREYDYRLQKELRGEQVAP